MNRPLWDISVVSVSVAVLYVMVIHHTYSLTSALFISVLSFSILNIICPVSPDSVSLLIVANGVSPSLDIYILADADI